MNESQNQLKEDFESRENNWMKKNPHHDFKSAKEEEEEEDELDPNALLENLPSAKKYQIEADDGMLSRAYKCFAKVVLQQQEMPYHKSGAVLDCQKKASHKDACLQNVQKSAEKMGAEYLFSNWKECVFSDSKA